MAELLKAIAGQGPLVALLILILWGGAKGVWIWGWQHREAIEDGEKDLDAMTRDRDFHRAIVYRQAGIIEKAVTVATERRNHHND